MKNATDDCPVQCECSESSREAEVALGEAKLSPLEIEWSGTKQECGRLRRQLEQEQQERKRLAKRHFELENRYTALARLHVAAERLLAPQSREDVYTAILEVVANLVGSEEVGVFRFDHQECNLHLVASCGIDPDRFATVALGSTPIGRAAVTGNAYIARDDKSRVHEDTLIACFPLRHDVLLGAVAIFGVLNQRDGFDAEAIELLEAIAKWASLALYCATIGAMTRKEQP